MISTSSDIAEQRIEDLRLRLGHNRDVHAVCDMAERWLRVKESVEFKLDHYDIENFAKLLKFMGYEPDFKAHEDEVKRLRRALARVARS